jgi:hypothetical protein
MGAFLRSSHENSFALNAFFSLRGDFVRGTCSFDQAGAHIPRSSTVTLALNNSIAPMQATICSVLIMFAAHIRAVSNGM